MARSTRPAEKPTTIYVVVDEPDHKPPRLFVDANANGDLTDDPRPVWNAQPDKNQRNGNSYTTYQGRGLFAVTYGTEKRIFHMAIYRFDKNDARYARKWQTTCSIIRDYARAGEVPLGGKSYKAMLLDQPATVISGPAMAPPIPPLPADPGS